MACRFRAIVVVVLICLVVNHRGSEAGRTRRRQGKHSPANKQPDLTFKEVIDRFRSRPLPTYQNRFFSMNLTKELSAPRYMLNLYNSLKNNSVEDDSEEFNITNITTTKPVNGADTIMGILNDVPDNEQKASDFYMKFKFNFTAKMKANESVAAAEFRIYKDRSQYLWMRNMSFVVQLDVITIPGSPVKLSSELTKRVVHGWETEWLVFDVTSTVDIWIVSPKNNYGLVLTVTTLDNQTPIPVDPGKFGFVGFKGAYQHRPFIVSFFRGDPTERSVILHVSERKRRAAGVFNPNTLMYGNKPGTKMCRLQHLYVDFRALSWENWIIAPDGYESSFCDGECSFPMLSPKNTTNHAIVQTLVHMLNPDTAPKACCAPSKLNAISVLFYDNNQNVILKKFKDMVVKSCGCH